VAIDKGAEWQAVQEMMGHASDYMTRRYTRASRKRAAAAMMPQFSPI
jgi:integrase